MSERRPTKADLRAAEVRGAQSRQAEVDRLRAKLDDLEERCGKLFKFVRWVASGSAQDKRTLKRAAQGILDEYGDHDKFA